MSNHFPINRKLLEKFTYTLLREGDKRKKNKNQNMDSLNLLLEKDISEILPKESFKMKSGSFSSFAENDAEEILNEFEFRESEKNYISKKLILMNEGERFLRVVINDHYNLESHQQEESIKITMNPVHILFEIVFFRNIKLLLDYAMSFSERKL